MKIQEIRTGKTVDVNEKLAAVIVARGRHRYLTATLVAERTSADASESLSDPEIDISPRTGKPKRRYKRRDMKAEE